VHVAGGNHADQRLFVAKREGYVETTTHIGLSECMEALLGPAVSFVL
jgi:hypothetical protein